MEYLLDTSIGFRLNRTANIIHAGFTKCIEPFGIAPEQFATLKIISEDGEITQSEIAEILAKGKPTVSRALDALEKKELIVRERKSEDRRIKPIHLTAKGQEILDLVIPKALTFNNAIKARLTPEEIETFFRVLDTIVDTSETHTKQLGASE
ncbi:MarR family transcriptional regulator [Sulfurimonas sp. HSL-3221]|uniref:MarR family winged helix-turn-helix transcriptional regulator n=1 Tax=Sulfurimonadaceae TaxID=2771471 RepID=UPI001E4D2E37|nr:MarR family transcriptional regulator [Sulfurimonas sp. HSL-3221]UFS61617.1 MarR family transcriptional regulator [Sulfurimonas sp. HSL-3221]